MKKSQNLYTIGVLSVVLSTLCFMNVSCAVDAFSDHDISFTYENQSKNHCEVVAEQKKQNTQSYDQSNDCYNGCLANMFTSYSKCQIVVAFQFEQLIDEFCLSSDFFTKDNGIRVRLVASFYRDNLLVFSHNYNGQLLLADQKKSVCYSQHLDSFANKVEVSIQAYYDNAKGGTNNSIVYFENLKVVKNNKIDEFIDKSSNTFIDYDASSDYYFGKLTDLRVDYSKSEVVTNKIKIIDEKNMKLQAFIASQNQGDFVRVIARFYYNDNLVDQKAYTGVCIDNSIDLTYDINYTSDINYVDFVIQAKYDSDKGGSKDDVISIDKLNVIFIDKQEEKENENINNDEYIDININQLINYDESTDSWFGTFCNLKSTYPELGLSTDLIYIGDCTQDIVLTCDFISDNSGDYIRFIVDYYSIDHQLQQTVKYNGVLCQKNQICKFVKQLEKYDSQYITVTVQCKYDSKKGGTKQDTVQFNGLALISN